MSTLKCRCGSDDKIRFESSVMIRIADGKPHICLGAEVATIPAESTPEPSREEYQKIHDKVWKFSVEEAAKVSELDAIGKNILSQVFYKKNMDMLIHSKGVVEK